MLSLCEASPYFPSEAPSFMIHLIFEQSYNIFQIDTTYRAQLELLPQNNT